MKNSRHSTLTFAGSPPHFATGAAIGVEDAEGQLVDDQTLALVEELDDTIFDALEGDPAALDRASRQWRRIRHLAPASLVDESRDQYLRRANSILRLSQEHPVRMLSQQFAALEVLALMAE